MVSAAAIAAGKDQNGDCYEGGTGVKKHKVYELPPYWVSYEIYTKGSMLFNSNRQLSIGSNTRRVVVLTDGMVIKEDVRLLNYETNELNRIRPIYETKKIIYQLEGKEKDALKAIYSFNLLRALKITSFRRQRTGTDGSHLSLSVVEDGETQDYFIDQGSEYAPRQLEAIVYDIDRFLSQPEIMSRKHKNSMLDSAEKCYREKTEDYKKLVHITQGGIDIPVRFDGLTRSYAQIINGGLKVSYCGDSAYGETVFLLSPKSFQIRDAWNFAEEAFKYAFPEASDIKGGLVYTAKTTHNDKRQEPSRPVEGEQSAYGEQKGTVKTLDGQLYTIELKVERIGIAYRLYTKVSKH